MSSHKTFGTQQINKLVITIGGTIRSIDTGDGNGYFNGEDTSQASGFVDPGVDTTPTGILTQNQLITRMPDRPMWPNIVNADTGLKPFVDQNRVRKFADTTHLQIGARFNFSSNDSQYSTDRYVLLINPREAELQRVEFAGSWPNVAGWTMPQENWRLKYKSFPDFFQSDYHARAINWLKPGVLDGGSTPTVTGVPLVHHLQPHGMMSTMEPYHYFQALEAAELGQPWLVDGYYQHIRNLRNVGVDTITHIGTPTRNEDWSWYSQEDKNRVTNMLDYGKCIPCFDNIVAFEETSLGADEAVARWDKGAGFAIEGIPLPSKPYWDSTPYSVLSWADGAYDRIIAGTVGSYPLADTAEFEQKYGVRQWLMSFSDSYFNYYGQGSMPNWNDTGTIVADYLDAVAVKTKAFFTAFAVQPNQGTLVCLLSARIINLAIEDSRVPSDFVS